MPAAARLGDKAQVASDAHGCPACPHPGVGPIVVGSPDVFINKLPAARVDDPGVHAACCGPNTFQIVKGSPSVYVNKKPLARMNDKTKHCGGDGPIIEGSPDVLIDDGASAEGLGSYVINALKMLLDKAMEVEKGKAEEASDSNAGKSKGTPGSQDLAKDGADTKGAGSIARAGWNLAKALNGQEVEIQIDCRDPKGSLQIEIWAMSSDRAQDKAVSKLDAQAAATVKKKVKLDIPPDAAGGNECYFYYVVKDAKGGEKRSDTLFVDRAPLRFSGASVGGRGGPPPKPKQGRDSPSGGGDPGAPSAGPGGPGAPPAGPGAPPAGPGTSAAGPGAPAAGPGAPAAGPGHPAAGPGGPAAGPGAPAAGPGAPAAGPSPAARPGAPAAGPGAPAAGPVGPKPAAQPSAAPPQPAPQGPPKPADPPAAKKDDPPPSDSERASPGEKAAEAPAIQNEPGLEPLRPQYRAALEKSANDMSQDEAGIILAFLHHAGFIQLLKAPFLFKESCLTAPKVAGDKLSWPRSGDHVGLGCWVKFKDGGEPLPKPGASKIGPIEGHVGFMYKAGVKSVGHDRAEVKKMTAQVGDIDTRSAVATYRAANWLNERYGVSELVHVGFNNPTRKADCHGQGRALDFTGVIGSLNGTPFEWSVYNDWGNQPVPADRRGDGPTEWAYKNGITSYRLAHRLDEPQPSPARFFWDFFQFARTNWNAAGSPELPRTPDGKIDKDGFIYYPDTFVSNKGAKSGREAHKDHIHLQIGPTLATAEEKAKG